MSVSGRESIGTPQAQMAQSNSLKDQDAEALQATVGCNKIVEQEIGEVTAFERLKQ